jgi:tetratricopeptide (TPR) repeat protein
VTNLLRNVSPKVVMSLLVTSLVSGLIGIGLMLTPVGKVATKSQDDQIKQIRQIQDDLQESYRDLAAAILPTDLAELLQKSERSEKVGLNKEAKLFLERAKSIAKKPDERARVSLHLSGVQYALGSRIAGRKELEAAIKESDRGVDRHLRAEILGTFGLVEKSDAHFDDADGYFARAQEVFVAISDIQGQAKTFHNIGILLREQGRSEEAFTSFQQALALNRSLNRHAGTINNLTEMAKIRRYGGRHSESFDLYDEAHTIALAHGEYRMAIQATYGLALEHREKGRFDDALRLFKDAVQYAIDTDESGMEMNLQAQVGLTYELSGRILESEPFFLRSLQMAREFKSDSSIALYGRDLARYKIANKNYREAEKLFREGLAAARKSHELQLELFSLTDIGVIGIETGDRGKAREFLCRARSLARQHPSPIPFLEISQVINQNRIICLS